MEEVLRVTLEVGLVFLLVLANGYFVAAEFAIIRAQPNKLKGPELQGKFGVSSALKLIEQLDQSLSSTQLGITISSLLLGWWGQTVFQKIFVSWFAALGVTLGLIVSHILAAILAIALITYFHVVLGELVAKSVAIRYPESTLRFLSGGMRVFTKIFSPFLWFLNISANLILRLLGINAQVGSDSALSGAEIAMLVTRSTAGGLLDKEEEEMIHGVFEFSHTVAREVMTPRTDLVTIPVNSTLEECMGLILESGLSRFPVIDGRVDNVVGVLLARDVMPHMSERILKGEVSFDLNEIMREPYYVPNTKVIDDLLGEFKKRKIHMAVVLDEHGGVDGVVTMEDLLEEIVGEIFDESDELEVDIDVQPNGEVVLDGGVLVDELNNRFQVEIPDGDYDTVAGFILTTLGQVPAPGTKVFLGKGRAWSESDYEALQAEPEASTEANGTVEEESEEELGAKAIVTVNKVVDHRIEELRLTLLKEEVSESLPAFDTSQGATVHSIEKSK